MSSDMSAVIVPKSDQINADDLIAGPISVTIRSVAIQPGQEQPVAIDIGVAGKVYRPCKSMSRVLVAAWGPDAKAYVGRSLSLYRDPTVKWGGIEVGGIRISHMSNIDREMTMALTATKGSRKPYTVKPLAARTDPPSSGSGVERQGEGPEPPPADFDALAFVESFEPRLKSVPVADLAELWRGANASLLQLRRTVPDDYQALVDLKEARKREATT